MATVDKPAGSGGTYTYTLTAAPAAPPTRTIFTDAARTVTAAAAQVMTATGSPVQFTGTYPLTLAAGRYFLRHAFSTAGGAALVDDDDELLLVAPDGTVGGTYATVQDVAAGFRPLTAPEALIVPTLIDRAESILLATVPSIPTRVVSGTLSTAVVVAVETAMVERVLRNPGGRRQESQSIDDYTTSWTIDNAVSSGALYVSDAEVALLSPPGVRQWAGSVRLGLWS